MKPIRSIFSLRLSTNPFQNNNSNKNNKTNDNLKQVKEVEEVEEIKIEQNIEKQDHFISSIQVPKI